MHAGFAIFSLFVTHHLHLPTFFSGPDASPEEHPHLAAQRLFGNASFKSNDPTVFSNRLVEQVAFKRCEEGVVMMWCELSI